METRIIVARSALDLIRREAGSRTQSDELGRVLGGILIGKRLDAGRLAIVAATDPGPQPDNDQLGFALDLDYANTTLQEWFGRDADVDLIGVWHTAAGGAEQATARDLQAANGLREQAGDGDVVVALAGAGSAPSGIRFFHLASAGGDAPGSLVPVAYDEVDDTALARGEIAAALPAAATRPPAGPGELEQRDEGDPREAGLARWAPVLLLFGAALLALFLVGSLLRMLVAANQEGAAATDTPVAVAAATVISSPAASVEQTSAPEVTVSPTEPPAATVAPTTSPTRAPSPTATPVETATAGPAQQAATTTPIETATAAASSLPFALSFEPMDAEAQDSFLARAEAADCADCYNLELVGPEPFEELRIVIEGVERPPLRNFAIPSLAFLRPRPEPYTLQVQDLEGNSVAAPLEVQVEEGGFYMLALSRTQP
ncbi:MAG: hypothetical protein AVDCRST_MAG26-2985 [uncultured Chloroflexia bacterium]|uniref:Uncharacterized protein n=1 Tax=uncultured Chloroflexia bacterium TaxID=1672391 RepID=A0A6J4JEB7_9CHLR|nr:MAG: hypothetical protein AVDCRST_MAG26-2985 [uncultured Chloroflexia bacterium]